MFNTNPLPTAIQMYDLHRQKCWQDSSYISEYQHRKHINILNYFLLAASFKQHFLSAEPSTDSIENLTAKLHCQLVKMKMI